MTNLSQNAVVPCQLVGPMKIIGPELNGELQVPFATFEAPLWPSVNRGAKISRLTAGIKVTILRDCMTRSILLSAESSENLANILSSLQNVRAELNQAVAATGRFVNLLNIHPEVVGDLLFLRLEFSTGDAAGHNMTTKASEAVLGYLLKKYPELKYISVSGNFCTDKKVSAVNSILGRGKYVVAEILIPKEICEKHLKTKPEKIVELNIKKNLLGSIISGGVCSANAHFANMLLGVFLATGQDAANIVEGSQGLVHVEMRGADLYFSVTLPNIIVGTAGKSKKMDFSQENLRILGCLEQRIIGANSRRLAGIIGATVLCGELSLLAALTNYGELMRTHELFER
ncbi:MAG: hydroxymethylglutaryl-CoA reductase [Gammaproteobacteria bacterium]|nr:hydroxymethylglutaryl-CoA reductase [Gammaproteobacteria bacterium]